MFYLLVKSDKLCIEVSPLSTIAFISEEFCIGCVKKCPFNALNVIITVKNNYTAQHRLSCSTIRWFRRCTENWLRRTKQNPSWYIY